MRTIVNFFLFLVFMLILVNCKKSETMNTYSDCSGKMNISFALPGDWNFRTCEDFYIAVEKPDNSYWISVEKYKTNQTTIDSMVKRDKNVFSKSKLRMLEEGTFKISDNDSYFFEWQDRYLNKFKAYLTYQNGYIYSFKFETKDTLIYNKNKYIFEDFITSVKLSK
jgi:hypothetical protein